MQRTLTRLGMAWQKNKKKGKVYRESPEIIQKRRTYLHTLFEYHSLPPSEQYLEVWTDESYIHHHHAFNGSMHSVEDFVGRQHFGLRLVILAAGSQLGFIPNSLKVYCAQKSSGDYHGNIGTSVYYKWFTEQLIPNLTQKSLIIMDNASYHVALPSDAPKLNASKKNIQQWLKDYQIPFEEYDLLDSLRLLLKEQVIPFVKPTIVRVAETEGHRILFQPPHHSDLQAIELIWAQAKGQVAKQYSNSTTFKEVEERLLEAFRQIT